MPALRVVMIAATANFTNANAALAKQLVHVFTIAGYTRVFTNVKTGVAGEYPWIKSGDGIGTLSQHLQDLQGNSTISDLDVIVLDVGNAITADFPTFTFQGKTATIQTGFANLGRADFSTVATMVVDEVESVENNTAYRFHLKNIMTQLLRRKVFRVSDTNRNTGSKNPKTLSGNPMDLLLQVLQTELALPNANINLTVINALKAGLFAGNRMKFVITNPPEAKQWLDLEIHRALGGWNFVNYLGQYTPYYEIPTAAPSVALTLTDHNLAKLPEPGEATMINGVEYLLDHDGSIFVNRFYEEQGTSISQFGLRGNLVIQARGVRSFYGGWSFGRLVANIIFQRYAFKGLLLSVTALWPAVVLEIGDYVRLTHPLVPDRIAGKLGITNRLCEVVATKKNFVPGTVELGLLDASWLDKLVATQIAPDGTPAWTAASAAQKAQFLFASSAGVHSDGTAGQAII